MTRLYCNNLGVLHSQQYTGKTGKKYEFHKSNSTTVEDPEDVMFFLNAGQGAYFTIDAPTAEVKKIFDKIKDAVKEVLASREASARAVAQEEVKKELAAASIDDHYGLADEEYKEAMSDNTILEFRKILEPGDTKKVRESLARWAKDNFEIVLHHKTQSLESMTAEFWVSWKKITPEKVAEEEAAVAEQQE